MIRRLGIGYWVLGIAALAISAVGARAQGDDAGKREEGRWKSVAFDVRQIEPTGEGFAGSTAYGLRPTASLCQVTTTRTVKTAKLSRDAQEPGAAPPVDKSIAVSQTAGSLSILYLADGKGAGYTALAIPLYKIGTSGLTLNATGAIGLDGKTQVMAGLALSDVVYNRGGFGLTLYAGLTGFNLANGFSVQTGVAKQFVFGVGVTIPFKGI